MNASRQFRAGLVVVVAELMVCLLSVPAFAGIGIGFGGIGIGVGRGGQHGHGPGHRVQSAKKQLHGRRQGQATRVAPRTTTQARTPTASTRSSHPVVRPQATAAAAKPAPLPRFPLELLDVRLIDIGNAALGEGPRFRVVLRNATSAPLRHPLEVMISGGISDAFSAELPTAVQGIEPLGPGQIVPVELRLPAEAMAMAYPGHKQPYPFSTLFVHIGGPKNMLGSSSITKLAVLPLGEIRLADIALAPPARPDVPVGQPLELRGEGFGPQTGRVVLSVGGVKLNLEVLGWSELGVAVQMPKLAISEPTNVQLQVLRADGQPAKPLSLTAVLPDVALVAEEKVPFPRVAEQRASLQPAIAPSGAVAATSPGSTATSDTPSEPATPQQPLSLAQAFGNLGLPPSDK